MTVSRDCVDLERYEREGYLFPFTIFEGEEARRLIDVYTRLRALLPPEASTEAMDWWHQLDRELYEVCMTPRILDVVESILGPDFYLWGSQFFCKEPGQGKTVPWHQDAYYWPLTPHNTVTAWLAFADSFEENGAMKVIPGTHTGRLKHVDSQSDSDVLNLTTEAGQFREADAVTLTLKAGQMSVHDDNIVHGSGPNRSDRLRCGLTMRFSAGEVRCDTSVWPFFKAYWARGTDRWRHNPVGAPPVGPMTRFQSVTPRTGQKA